MKKNQIGIRRREPGAGNEDGKKDTVGLTAVWAANAMDPDEEKSAGSRNGALTGPMTMKEGSAFWAAGLIRIHEPVKRVVADFLEKQ